MPDSAFAADDLIDLLPGGGIALGAGAGLAIGVLIAGARPVGTATRAFSRPQSFG